MKFTPGKQNLLRNLLRLKLDTSVASVHPKMTHLRQMLQISFLAC